MIGHLEIISGNAALRNSFEKVLSGHELAPEQGKDEHRDNTLSHNLEETPPQKTPQHAFRLRLDGVVASLGQGMMSASFRYPPHHNENQGDSERGLQPLRESCDDPELSDRLSRLKSTRDMFTISNADAR